MNSGIFDRVLFWVNPKSPLRSDRMMGFYTTLAMVMATAMGFDWNNAADLRTVNYIQELFTGVSGIVTSLSSMTMILGQIRSEFSDREF